MSVGVAPKATAEENPPSRVTPDVIRQLSQRGSATMSAAGFLLACAASVSSAAAQSFDLTDLVVAPGDGEPHVSFPCKWRAVRRSSSPAPLLAARCFRSRLQEVNAAAAWLVSAAPWLPPPSRNPTPSRFPRLALALIPTPTSIPTPTPIPRAGYAALFGTKVRAHHPVTFKLGRVEPDLACTKVSGGPTRRREKHRTPTIAFPLDQVFSPPKRCACEKKTRTAPSKKVEILPEN